MSIEQEKLNALNQALGKIEKVRFYAGLFSMESFLDSKHMMWYSKKGYTKKP